MRVDVRAAFPRRDRLDAEVDFTITVPSGASVSVRSGSGDVTVTGVRGELRAEAVSGGITATSVGQVRLLRTLSGAVQLENADSSDITVSTLGRTGDDPAAADAVRGSAHHRRRPHRLGQRRGAPVGAVAHRAHRARRPAGAHWPLLAPIAVGRRAAVALGRRLRAGSRHGERHRAIRISDHGWAIAARPRPGPGRRRSRHGRGGRAARVCCAACPAHGGPLVTLRTFSGDIAIARR